MGAALDRTGTSARPDAGLPDLEAALHAARSGSEAGFVALYRDLQPRLLRYATALVGADAEDVTAETWLQVARDLHGFRGDLDGFRGWASTICRNRAMDLARARARRPSDPTELEFLTERPGQADTAGTALDTLSTEAAVAMIARLPRDQAEAVLLRAVVGLDAATAGAVLGKSAGAVRVAAHRGLKRLARELEARGARA
ncbi:MAG TPA: RNA polymerase sigma factor [Pseudonocardia sp.]|nr:RNA polymerase sigma factor [Pseudonocardia sp.]